MRERSNVKLEWIAQEPEEANSAIRLSVRRGLEAAAVSVIDRATSEERRRKCPIERAEEGSAMEEEGEGDGIYNIYVSSAIRRCLLASLLRLRSP